jgi:small subunit ribosomal protein S12
MILTLKREEEILFIVLFVVLLKLKMSTKNQLILKKNRIKKIKKNKKLLLDGCPQKKGTCLKVFVTSPKKPNSASRKVIKVVLLSSKKKTHCHIPGIKHSLQRYSTVLIRGGRVKDLPGVKYRVIRGKFDLKRVYDRFKARSKYGISKLDKN